MVKRLTVEEKQQACIRYQNGESSCKIGQEMGVSSRAIRGILARRGIDRRTQEIAQRRFTCNYKFFESIDTEAKAYWLGFILADGCICGKELMVAVHSKDVDHLRKLAADMDSTHSVKSYSYPYKYGVVEIARFIVKSDVLVADLSRHGVTARKSFSATPPVLSSDLARHFWRGVVDGDGSLNGTRKHAGVRLVGSLETCEAFCLWTRRLTNHKSSVYPHKSIYQIHLGGTRQTARIVDALYSDATVFLDRKANIASSIQNAAWNIRALGRALVNAPYVANCGSIVHDLVTSPSALAVGY